MTTDFNYSNTAITSSGPFKPKNKNVPLNARYRVETYVDIANIPVPAVGELVFVLSDENNDNQQNIYVIKSLKANALGMADSLVDEVVPLKTFLGTDDIDLSDYVTEDELMNLIPNKTSDLVNDSNFISSNDEIDADKINGKTISEPMTKQEYDAIADKDPNTIYLVDDDTTITGVPDYSISDANKVLAVNSNGTALAWIDVPSGSGNGLTTEQILELNKISTLEEKVNNNVISINRLKNDVSEIQYNTGSISTKITIPIFSKLNPHANNKLNIITYPEGENQPMHPKVLYFENKWNGYKYWMAYTPLPNEDNENPCIAVSNDMINWTIPDGLENPLAQTPGTGAYNSDAHLVYVDTTNTLECWYREIPNTRDSETIYKRTTTNGSDWTEPELVMQTTGSITANLSPACIYEDNIYKLWTCSNSKTLKYYESSDGKTWGEPREIVIEGGSWWHLDVIHTYNGYELLIYTNTGKNLYYTKSIDNITYSTPVEVLVATEGANDWDGENLYRSSFFIKDGYYYIFYSGRHKTTLEWGIGLTRGKNMLELNGLETSKEVDIAEALIELYNSDISSSNNIAVDGVTLNQSSLSLRVDATYELIATVTPDNATNKQITWVSSDTNIATVNNGMITAIAEGECVITAKSINNKTATCSLVVDNNSETIDDGVVQDNLICWVDTRDGSRTQNSLNDRTSYSNNFTLNNFDYNGNSGWTGTSLKFDGTDDYCLADNPSVLNGYSTSSDFGITICVNAKINKVNVVQQDIFDLCSSNKARFLLMTDNKISFQQAGKLKTSTVVAEADKTYDMVYIYRSYQSLTANITRYAMYVDGVKVYEEFSDSYGSSLSNFNMCIGSEDGTTSFANMNLNSIKIYNKELSEEEITQNYNYEKSIQR